MDTKDLQQSGAMLAGAGLGALIGWALFTETYNIAACGIIGCAIGQFTAKWWRRRRRGRIEGGASSG